MSLFDKIEKSKRRQKNERDRDERKGSKKTASNHKCDREKDEGNSGLYNL